MNKIFEKKETVTESEEVDEEEEKKMVMIKYRGKISDQLKNSLNKLNAPCRIIFTLKKNWNQFYRPLNHPLINPWRLALLTKLRVHDARRAMSTKRVVIWPLVYRGARIGNPVGTRHPRDVPRTVHLRPNVPVPKGRPWDVPSGPNGEV